MKVGRNEPCPCGSGKKYKKCCLEKDEKEQREILTAENIQKESSYIQKDEWEPEDDDFWKLDEGFETPDVEYDDSELDDTLEEFETDKFSGQNDDDETSVKMDQDDTTNDDSSSEDKLPEISEEENKLVDEWWDAYKKMHDTVKEREHLIAFIDKYPHLTEYLELHWEVLFEIGAGHLREGIYDTYIDLLLRIRRDFLNAYKKSYGYYDADIIYWLTSKGRFSEIDQYFTLFKEDKTDEFVEQLCDTIDFLFAVNRSDLLLSLSGSPCRRYIISNIGNRIVSKYIDKEISEETVHSLINELKSDGIEPNMNNIEEEWRKKLSMYKRPFILWDETLPRKRSEALQNYFQITTNFASYLYQKTELSFDSAVFYADTVYDYYRNIVSGKKRPENIFCLDKRYENNMLENQLFYRFNLGVSNIVLINALYYFASYLCICGNMTDTQKYDYQQYLKGVYSNNCADIEKIGPEMFSFKQFPLWQLKDE